MPGKGCPLLKKLPNLWLSYQSKGCTCHKSMTLVYEKGLQMSRIVTLISVKYCTYRICYLCYSWIYLGNNFFIRISDALITAQEVPFQMGGESTTTLKKILEDVENNELDHYILLTDSILSILRLCQTNSTGNQELNKVKQWSCQIRWY